MIWAITSSRLTRRCDVHDLQATILHALGFDPFKFTFPYQGLNQRLIGPATD